MDEKKHIEKNLFVDEKAASMKEKLERDSNMELLRAISMLLVLVVHANFTALSVPDAQYISINALSAFFRFLTESFSIIAVNVFVLLSGWYGIHPKMTRFGRFLFQVLFFGVICMCIEWALSGRMPQNVILTILTLSPSSNYWFFKTYLALFIISPVLNSFVENAKRRQFEYVLVGFPSKASTAG